MATIKAIEGASVHQIQSGQVIVDLCSVVKELVENSLDAGATSIDIRFKNNGLDSIEVQDNGSGISPTDYTTIALKHYTSKLSSYSDLSSLTTFGFRGEALSSLCALSTFHIITAKAEDGSKGTKLEFETSGELRSQNVVAAQRGTTVCVEGIFGNLPVRRRELVKNVKREYGKVLGLLNAYACISVGVRFSVSNQPAKGKKVVVFSTKANPTTRENIANVYGAKTLLALLPLDMELHMQPALASTQSARNWSTQVDTNSTAQPIHLEGHISRPVVGEGRQTPDRQMFFVNSRPCALPQVAKAINEVYKSYNVTQSPFIFANLKMDTGAYDVNVSPDKRTILLHDQNALLEALKTGLGELFEKHDQSVPQASVVGNRKLPSYKPLRVSREASGGAVKAVEKDQDKENADDEGDEEASDNEIDASMLQSSVAPENPGAAIRKFVDQDTETPEDIRKTALAAAAAKKRRETAKAAEAAKCDGAVDVPAETDGLPVAVNSYLPKPVQDFNTRLGVQMAEPRKLSSALIGDSNSSTQEPPPVPQFITGIALLEVNAEGAKLGVPQAAKKHARREEEAEEEEAEPEDKIPSVTNTPQKSAPGIVQNAFDRMRSKRPSPDTATVTIGNQTTVTTLGQTPDSAFKRRRVMTPKLDYTNGKKLTQPSPLFARSLRGFAAPGSQMAQEADDEIEEDEVDATPVPAALRRVSNRTAALPTSSLKTDTSILDIDSPSSSPEKNPAVFLASDDPSDDEYMDPAEKKAREEAKVEKLIRLAEEKATRPSSDNVKRANTAMRSKTRKDSTLTLVQYVKTDVQRIEKSLGSLTTALQRADELSNPDPTATEHTAIENGEPEESSAESRLSLTVSKSDFSFMRIIGQFNLGFILALRPSSETNSSTNTNTNSKLQTQTQDELFIIDQHASDEKYNFERLYAETIVRNQRLVRPLPLDLTAVEEEIVIEHLDTLEKNGFILEVDESGDVEVGKRCRVISLPMSKETTFSVKDLEELIALLADGGGSAVGGKYVPRPSKVRSMFAMRACRSSIMIGKSLSKKQMGGVVRHMGEIDRPWNCPHGRPTMRHLFCVGGWEGWDEGDLKTDWSSYCRADGDGDVVYDGIEEDDGVDGGGGLDPKEWLFTQK
ncbi:DNA mismatch repair protein MutL [Tothia fuscella]|uniref:DNA mismatch repair protein PMS1 n=1 Tax=Tothia fuscella TaxID=1048955 RepID=A0A9P4NR57_9PEZI|nr:DNA mismatch repair protein MutL [Tothia fuscella]